MTHLLNQINTSLQVHAKVNKFPLYAFFLVLFLFQHKHVVIEKLLQFLICKINAELLEAVKL